MNGRPPPAVQRNASQRMLLDLATTTAVIELRGAVRALRALERESSPTSIALHTAKLRAVRQKRDAAVAALEAALEEP